MTIHLLNLFAIENLAQLRCTYRLLEVTNLVKDTQHAENLQRLVFAVSRETRHPVSIYPRGEKTYLATTAVTDSLKREWRLIPHVALLVPEGKDHQLEFGNLRPEQIEFALNAIRYNIRTSLNRVQDLWNDSAASFYLRTSASYSATSPVDVLEGFSIRLHYVGPGKVFLSLDATAKYVERKALADRLKDGEDFGPFKYQPFLYRFGYQWYRVQVMGLTGSPISQQFFQHEKDNCTHNVHDYTLQNCRQPHPDFIKNLDPSSPAIIYRYPNVPKQFYGAAALCFKTYKTDDPEVRPLHSASILDPTRRLEKCRGFVRGYFQDVRFVDGTKLAITDQPLSVPGKHFNVPDLLFGGGKILHVQRDGTNKGVPLSELGRKRMDLLRDRDGGVLVSGVMHKQYVLIPQSLPRAIAERFQQEFVHHMEELMSSSYSITKILYDDRSAKTLAQQVATIKHSLQVNRIDRGCALLILPARAHRDLHNFIKKDLFDTLQFQCVSADSLNRYFCAIRDGYVVRNDAAGKFASYTRNTAIGMLLVNHRWPFALYAPLNYDIHIGIDVLNGIAGFTYAHNGGKDCAFRHYASQQEEKLSANQICSVLYQDLKRDIEWLGIRRSSIVIHRDGRSYAQEEKGFEAAVNRLKKEGILGQDVRIGVVEIHKTSAARLRIFDSENGAVRNPRVGAFFLIDEKQGIVCSTGWPFRFPGTVNPLHVSIAFGDLDIEKVLSDIFAFSQLAWSAPDKASRLPITIKLGDMFLQPMASESDEEAALYGEEEVNEDTSPVEVSAREKEMEGR
jgi:hypothetical protein